MAQTMLAMTILVAILVAHGVSAKRGCAAFGHSCFGGHGKRSAATSMEVMSPPLLTRQQGQEETPPQVYDRAYNILEPGDNIIPIRDGGVYDREDAAREALKIQFRNIFKHWVNNYRRSQQNTDYAENV